MEHFVCLAVAFSPDETHVRFAEWRAGGFAMSLPIFSFNLGGLVSPLKLIQGARVTCCREIGVEDIKHGYSNRFISDTIQVVEDEAIIFTHYLQRSSELTPSLKEFRERLRVADLQPILARGNQDECITKLEKGLGPVTDIPSAMGVSSERPRPKWKQTQHVIDVGPEIIARQHPRWALRIDGHNEERNPNTARDCVIGSQTVGGPQEPSDGERK